MDKTKRKSVPKSRLIQPGERFGRLTILRRCEKQDNIKRPTDIRYEARCACGTVKMVRAFSLFYSGTVSCGCHSRKMLRLSQKNQIYERSRACTLEVGMKFGRLTITGPYTLRRRNGRSHVSYPVRCDCGAEKKVKAQWLLKGSTASCGCLQVECRANQSLTHGASKSRLYTIWVSMLQRCFNKKCFAYRYYGVRGITACEQWMTFDNFRAWALANGYADHLSIDRIDFNGNYEPSNCRWIAPERQASNRRDNRLVTAFGETKCLADWERDPRAGAKSGTIARRLWAGMPPEKAITLPPNGEHSSWVNVTAFGETKPLERWVRDPRCKVTSSTIKRRLRLGIAPEDAMTLPYLWPKATRHTRPTFGSQDEHSKVIEAIAKRHQDKIASFYVTAFGETRYAAEWSRDPRCKVEARVLIRRIRQGMPAEEAMAKPVRMVVTAFGESKSISEWLRDHRCRVKKSTLLKRLNDGMLSEEAIATPDMRFSRG